MDVLSDVLRVVRLSGSVFFTAHFSSPWALESPNPRLLTCVSLPEAECIALFHIVIDGECWVDCQDHEALHLTSGDVIIFPHAHPHTMRSKLGVNPTPIGKVLPSGTEDELLQIQWGGGGQVSRFICGYLACDQRFKPLVGSLPTILIVRGCDDHSMVEAVTSDGTRATDLQPSSGTWLHTTLRYTISEASSPRPGNAAMLGRLTELMFLEILREYMQRLPTGQTGWLAGLRDPHVGKALRLMHAEPAHRWTVEELARKIGISRSALAQHFTELLQDSPMHYLASWRIQLARQLLRDGAHSIQEVAERVGYESEAAFSRAFKRLVGRPPAAWGRAATVDDQSQRGSVATHPSTVKRAAAR
jgi:AraC-like DNA-binding protein